MRIEIGKMIRNFVILVTILVTMVPGVLALTPAVPFEPSYMEFSSEVIDVDGNPGANPYGEWDLSADYFEDMNEVEIQGGSNHGLRSKLYLRYDCNNGILYVMVLLNDSINHEINIDESDKLFVKVNATDDINDTVLVNNVIALVNGNTGDNNAAPDLYYINDSSGKRIGWEASTPLSVGTYRLCVRTQVNTSDGVDTSGTGIEQYGIPLEIKCSPYVPIPEFPTIAIPVMAILGLMFIFGRKRDS